MAAGAASALAGEIQQLFAAQPPGPPPAQADWQADPRLANLNIGEIDFEIAPSGTRAQWQSFVVKFFSDGRVDYVGQAMMRNMGPHTGHIQVMDFKKLALLVDEMGFQTMALEYRQPSTTIATKYTSVVRDGVRRTIANAGDAAPVNLWAIELAARDLVNRIQWDRYSQPRLRGAARFNARRNPSNRRVPGLS